MDTLPTGGVRGVHGWLLDIGAVVHDRYRVTAVLGKGGFGVTYLVHDQLLHGKRRALKEVPCLLFDDYETRLLGRLSHPAIPDIVDRFERDGMVYQVLEFGGDRTLNIEKDRRGGRIPLFVLLPWMRQLCEALQYLHSQDPPVVHRDLKPDNVLIDEHDRVMLIDFGIAKEATPDTATRTIGRAISQGFSPPEQVLGTGTDARSDVYALGAIQYYCLTGQMPPPAHERISGKNIEPISKLLPEIPPLIEAAIMQAIELNINFRQQSIAELASVFDLIQSGTGGTPTISVAAAAQSPSKTGTGPLPSIELHSTRTAGDRRSPPSIRVNVPPPAQGEHASPRPRRRFLPVTAILLILLGVAGGGGYWWWSGQGPTQGSPSVAENDATPDTGAAPAKPTEEVRPGKLDTVAAEEPEPAPSSAVDERAADTGTASTPAQQGATAASQASNGAGIKASAQNFAVPDAGEQEPATALDVPPDPDPAAAVPASAATAGAAAAAAAAAAAVAAAAGPAATPGKRTPPPASVAVRPASVFSDEQPATSTSGAPIASDGRNTTLMELFERNRSVSLAAPAEPAEPELAPPPKAEPKKPAVVSVPKRRVAAAPKPTPKPKPKPKPRRRQQSQSSSSSDWGFQYKGSRKTY